MGTSVRCLARRRAARGRRALIEDLEARLSASIPRASCAGSTPTRALSCPRRPSCGGGARRARTARPPPRARRSERRWRARRRPAARVARPAAPRATCARRSPRLPRRAPPRPPRAKRGGSSSVGDDTILRPPGVRLDLGGSAKGYAADLAAARLALRTVRGRPRRRPACARRGRVQVLDPLDRVFRRHAALDGDVVATSVIGRRLWPDAGGQSAHHLLDPATNRPAWTGRLPHRHRQGADRRARRGAGEGRRPVPPRPRREILADHAGC